MKKGLVKYFLFISLLFMLLFSFAFSSFAGKALGSSESPYYYIFGLLVRSLNLPTSSGSAAQFADAYEGYLESVNDTSMLNKLKEYKSLSWNDTIPDINPLLESLHDWISLSPSYGEVKNNFTAFIDLPSSPDLPPSSIGMEGVQSTPFTDVNTPSDLDGYVYLWSDAYLDTDENGREIYVRRDIYVPDGVKIVSSLVTQSSIFSRFTLYRTAIKAIEAKSISTVYYMDDYSIKQKDTSFSDSFSTVEYRIRSVMNLPFPVFSNEDSMRKYFSSGTLEHMFTNDVVPLWFFEYNRENDFFLDIDSLYFGKLILPSSYSNPCFSKYSNSDSFLSALKDAGLDIADRGTYTLETYKEDTEGNFIKEETEKLPGGIGRVPYISKTYPNFSLQEDLTTPKNGVVLEDGSLTVKMYYARDRIGYTVEHYQQNKDGTGWIKEEAENLSGLFGSEASFTAKTYPGFTFAEGLTEPDNLIISADNELTIKLYYLRDLISYMVEHYQQDIADESGKQDWSLVDQDLLSGLFETEAAFVPKNYSGFTFAEQLIEPDNRILPADDRTLTIKLYYTRNPVQYVIEYYTQNLIKQNESSGWTLADREVLSGIAGMQADCPKKSYAGLRYNSSLTEPADRRIRSDGSLVIRMYYVQNLFGDFKEPFETVTKKMIVLSAAVLPFTFIVLFLIRLFKQILSKA